ncbi:hypothetical protein [Psychroserpens sp.]|uniref:hypothetical protein n=1 Tax=Psychroserpens sp. TaxID=2020870 RepID=UPI001B04B0BD|nr:hypothetical protein [Psychroserpens sp.]MBO6606865.1 hypothetical protein [Psychroserpens sp.]MBO6632225.1 hypothetical protein [Psychroserpens sp.]MBO6654011.1 hypothetical protein [Psychroserpens sp.]MBO6682703.1 hypothetical protein [Psychroserpens sp.]MBO6750637.1 hypothetical protein [Psychroserpens sp.]
MSQDYNNPAFKKLLQKLQEESWQLELIISGFAIFGLFTIFDPLMQSVADAEDNEQIYKFVISLVATISCAILIFNLVLHVLLRGLWIGALGLRYVSGDIDYDSLKYSEKFTKYLKRRVGSFDRYIATLENYCSIIFAISFLLIFYVLAITFTILTIAFTANYVLDSDWLPGWISKGIGIPFMLFVVFGMLITFFDFVTLGSLKKKKWISKIYFPVYWVFSFITLSFLYRPLVYNFLDHKFGRRLSFVLVPFYIGIMILSSVKYQNSNYLKADLNSNDMIANIENYEDQLANSKVFTGDVTIPSKVIKDSYLKIFMPYSETVEDRVFAINPGLKPEKDIRGLKTDVVKINTNNSRSKRDSLTKVYIETFGEIYSIRIDSIPFESNFILSQNFREELGFETYLNLDSIPSGKHLLKINRMRIRNNDTTYWIVDRIPFWHFKN